MVTVDADGGQAPLLMVHTKILFPIDNPVTLLLALFTDATAAVPEPTDQLPCPVAGLFPCSVKTDAQMVWLEPAFDTLGSASLWIKRVADDGAHTPLLIFHSKIFVPVTRFEAVVLLAVELDKVDPPASTDQVPLPVRG
jgi:hypothetical protein